MDIKSVGGEITVGVRPQEVRLSKIKKDNGAVSAVVDLTQFQGESVIVTLVLDDQGKTEVKAVI